MGQRHVTTSSVEVYEVWGWYVFVSNSGIAISPVKQKEKKKTE